MARLISIGVLIVLSSSRLAPAVRYGTYLGGRDKDRATAIAVDTSTGIAWVAGNTPSADFPVTSGAFKSHASINNDDSIGFLTKLSPTGNRFLYSTFLGGSFRSSASAIAVDASGAVVVVGSTCSTDFPVTKNALQARPGGGGHGLEPCDGYIVKLDAALHPVFATYFGGTDADTVNAVAADPQGRTVIAGWTRSPELFGSKPLGESDAFIAMIDPHGQLAWIRRFGGRQADWFSAITIGAEGTIWAAGSSYSEDFPCSGSMPSRPYGFLLALSSRGDVSCIRFDGEAGAISPDTSGHVFVAGSTSAAPRVTGFVLRATLNHIDWYRRLGGSEETTISGISAGMPGSIFLCGSSYSRDFPVTRGALASYPVSGSDMVLLRLSAADGRVLYGTFLGGNAAADIAPMNNTPVALQADAGGSVWITGSAIGHPKWISTSAAQPRSHGNTDVFVLKLDFPK